MKFIKILSILSLVAAYASGFLIRENGAMASIKEAFPDKEIHLASQTKELYDLIDKESGLKDGSILVESGQGWGGPLKVALEFGSEGTVKNLVVLNHKETPSFFQHLRINGFFEQFSGKKLDEPFIVGGDIDAISSATISSNAFTKAARNSAHWAGNNLFDMEIEEEAIPFQFGINEMILMATYCLVLMALLKRFQKARLFTLGFSVLFLGFYMNRPISISNIGAAVMGFVPSPHDQPFWWLLVVGVLGLTTLVGKNFYCFWMCPFGGLQEFISRIGGVKIMLNKTLAKNMKRMVYVLLWSALMIIFLTSNPAMGNFEPFAVLFSLKGLGVQWYLLTLTVLGSLFIPRFWCRFFCPVGTVLQGVSKVKGKINNGIATMLS